MHMHKNLKQNKAAVLPFSKLSTFFNLWILCNSMDTKGPINTAPERNLYIYEKVDLFSNYIVTVPTPKSNARYAVNATNHHWISKFFPPEYLITDRGTECLDFEIANCSTVFKVRHSPRIYLAPGRNGLA